ncbi:hypothetical protein V8G54_024494 [Vigna mungo]|uniref:Uncharacterized protein n=1 Tax=Vigna mungo TaxID=3915 RepID=A0AAQ3N7I6_VIGMU
MEEVVKVKVMEEAAREMVGVEISIYREEIVVVCIHMEEKMEACIQMGACILDMWVYKNMVVACIHREEVSSSCMEVCSSCMEVVCIHCMEVCSYMEVACIHIVEVVEICSNMEDIWVHNMEGIWVHMVVEICNCMEGIWVDIIWIIIRIFGFIGFVIWIVVWLASTIVRIISSNHGRNYAEDYSIDEWRQATTHGRFWVETTKRNSQDAAFSVRQLANGECVTTEKKERRKTIKISETTIECRKREKEEVPQERKEKRKTISETECHEEFATGLRSRLLTTGRLSVWESGEEH